MSAPAENLSPLARKIQDAEVKLENLERAVIEIGQPAGHELQRRLEVLRIEEKALKRNFEESMARGEPDSVRLVKIEVLLRLIEEEEASVQEDAQFLQQAAPSSMGLAVEVGAQVVDLVGRGMKRVIGNHHPLGESVFVNHSHEALTHDYGLEEHEDPSTPPKS